MNQTAAMRMFNAKRIRRFCACAGALAVLAGLGACVAGPDYRPPEVDAPANWSDWHGGAADLALPDAAASPLPADRWHVFHDPELESLIARARGANPDIRIALLHLAQARVQETMVSAQSGIQVNATVDAARRRDSEYGANTRVVNVIGRGDPAPILKALGEPYSLYRPGFDASWELDLWGRVRRTEEWARAGTQEQGALLRQVQSGVAADVARNYFSLRSAQRQLRLLQRELAMSDDEVRLLDAQREGGLIDESAVIHARQQGADLRALLPVLQSQEARALNQISLLLDARPGDLNAQLSLPGQGDSDGGLPEFQAGIPSEFAHHRPDIVAAEARLHAATANIGAAAADVYPRITLGATFGLESVGTSHLDEWAARNWSLGPIISLPVFDHGRRTATITLRELEQQEAAIAFRQTVMKAWHEVDDAVSGYRAGVRQSAELQAKVVRGEQEAFLAGVRASRGTSSQLPYLDAQIAVLGLEQSLDQARQQQDIALVALFKALGD